MNRIKPIYYRHYVMENQPKRCPFCGLKEWNELLTTGWREGNVESAKTCTNCHATIVVPLPDQSKFKRFLKFLYYAWDDAQIKPDNHYSLVTGNTHS